MIQQSKFEHLYNNCGGVFKTTVLIQKRLRELNRGARKLVEDHAKNPIEVVMREMEAGRIELIADNDENREVIRAEDERMTMGQPQPIEVGEATSDDDLERRILSALAKDGK